MVIAHVRAHDHNLYILEQPSFWSTSWIRPSWPRSRLRLSFLLVSLSKCISCLLRPIQYLAVCPNESGFPLSPFISVWRRLTNVRVNNLTMLHDTHGHTHIYIRWALLFFFSFIFLPTFLAGRLAQTLPSDTHRSSNNYLARPEACVIVCNILYLCLVDKVLIILW
jgi:hypothetical protein